MPFPVGGTGKHYEALVSRPHSWCKEVGQCMGSSSTIREMTHNTLNKVWPFTTIEAYL